MAQPHPLDPAAIRGPGSSEASKAQVWAHRGDSTALVAKLNATLATLPSQVSG